MAELVVGAVQKWLLKKLITSAGGGAGGKLLSLVWDLLVDNSQDLKKIEAKIDQLAEEVSKIRGTLQAQAFAKHRKFIFGDYGLVAASVASDADTKANLDKIAGRYVPMEANSYYRHLSIFLAEVIGWQAADPVHFNGFMVPDGAFEGGLIHWHSANILSMRDLSLSEYIESMHEFVAYMIADLTVLSNAYATGLAALEKHGYAGKDVTRVERWRDRSGMLLDVLPLVLECERAVAFPVMDFHDISVSPCRTMNVSVTHDGDDWIVRAGKENAGRPITVGRYSSPETGTYLIVQPMETFKRLPQNEQQWRANWSLNGAPGTHADAAFWMKVVQPPKRDFYITLQRQGAANYWVHDTEHESNTRTLHLRLHQTKGRTNKKTYYVLDDTMRYPAARRSSTYTIHREYGFINDPEWEKRWNFTVHNNRLYGSAMLSKELSSIDREHDLKLDETHGPLLRTKEKIVLSLVDKEQALKLRKYWRLLVREDGLHLFADSAGYVDYSAAIAANDDDNTAIDEAVTMLVLTEEGELQLHVCRGDTATLKGRTGPDIPASDRIPVIIHPPATPTAADASELAIRRGRERQN